MENSAKSKCQECGRSMEGRRDKRFCGAQCRATWHNRNKADTERMIQKVNSVLRKNRTILKAVNPHGMTVLRKKYLEERGFNFKYFTSLYTTKGGQSDDSATSIGSAMRWATCSWMMERSG